MQLLRNILGDCYLIHQIYVSSIALANFLSLFRSSDRSLDMRVYACKAPLQVVTEVIHRLLDSFNEQFCRLELGRDGLEDII